MRCPHVDPPALLQVRYRSAKAQGRSTIAKTTVATNALVWVSTIGRGGEVENHRSIGRVHEAINKVVAFAYGRTMQLERLPCETESRTSSEASSFCAAAPAKPWSFLRAERPRASSVSASNARKVTARKDLRQAPWPQRGE